MELAWLWIVVVVFEDLEQFPAAPVRGFVFCRYSCLRLSILFRTWSLSQSLNPAVFKCWTSLSLNSSFVRHCLSNDRYFSHPSNRQRVSSSDHDLLLLALFDDGAALGCSGSESDDMCLQESVVRSVAVRHSIVRSLQWAYLMSWSSCTT